MTTTLPKSSPWGRIDGIETIAPGFLNVSTPSHGGIKLDRARNAKVPSDWRRPGGWYEEDCEYAIPFIVFSAEVLAWGDRQDWTTGDKQMACAMRTARNWLPDFYEHWTGDTLKPGESFKRAEAEFAQTHRTDWVVYSAFGDWHENVPADFVGVVARLGRTNTGPGRAFLIPTAEYDERSRFGYVIDTATAVVWPDHGLRLDKGAA